MPFDDPLKGARYATRMVGRRMVVVDTATGIMRVLNPSAAALWLLLEEGGSSLDALTGDFAALFGLAPEQAQADVADCLATWRAYGWLAAGPAPALDRSAAPLAMAVADRLEPCDPAMPMPPHAVADTACYRLRDTAFRVTLGRTERAGFDDILPRVSAFLSGFPRSAASEAAAEVRMVADGDRLLVRWSGGTVATADGSAGVARLVLAIYQVAYPGEPMIATLHAAALTGPRGTVLMPGRSGNGKSTLSAHLADRGWRYLADDSVGLAAMGPGRAPTVLPFPSALGLKPPTWPMMAARFPVLDDLPTVAYADKQARFLPLTAVPLPDRETCVPRAVVFPRYEAGAAVALVPLAPEEVMVRVAEAGMRTGEILDSGRIDQVLAFLEAVPAYALGYGDLDGAEDVLAAL